MEIIIQNEKTRIRKTSNKKYPYITDFWFSGNKEFNQKPKWINVGNAKTLNEAKIICGIK